MPKVTRNKRRKGRGSGRSRGIARTGEYSGSNGAAQLLADMAAYHDELALRYSALKTEMDALASAIHTVRSAGVHAGTSAKERAGVRQNQGRAVRGPRGEGASLKDYISRVLSTTGSAMRLTEVARAVVSAGYPTRSRNLPNQVSMALAAMCKAKKIRKVGHGLYSS